MAGVFVVALLAWANCAVLLAQPRPPRFNFRRVPQPNTPLQTGDENGNSVFYPPDRETWLRLNRARELIDEKRYGEAARFLSSILERPEDCFFQPERGQPIYRSLKQEAQRLIGELGEEGRTSYELQYGAEAKRLLDEAVTQGDRSRLAQVARQFFHTAAGYEATYLLGLSEMQRGQPLAAALCLERLRAARTAAKFEPTLTLLTAVCWTRAGRTEQGTALVRELRHKYPDAEFEIAGHVKKMFTADAQAAVWLAQAAGQAAEPPRSRGARQWTLYRGGPARNSASEGSSPLLNRRWAVPVADAPDLEQTLDKLSQQFLERGARIVPNLHPLAVRDYVLMRSLTGLEGVDFRTGKRIWNTTDKSVEDLIDAQPRQPGQPAMPLANWLQQRVWENAVYGTLSSDGEFVYCVDEPYTAKQPGKSELGNVEQGLPQQIVFAQRPFGMPRPDRASNELKAFEIVSQGKLLWSSEEEADLADLFFLGPPLPVAGSLYVLGEVKGEVRLYVLDPRTGKLEWSQQLVLVEPNPMEEHLRHTAGAVPSYSDGILVCPTSSGAVVAVDLTTRTLLWGHQYPKSPDGNFMQNRLMQFRFQQVPQVNDENADDRWADASVTVAGGQVLMTPVESSEMFCVGLTDGKLKWQKPRDDGLYVACVHDGKAIIVGSRTVKALRLSDGEPAWMDASLALPSNSTPSGRGFYNGDRYYLPLSSAEVAAIDLDEGRIVARSRSRSGTVPGNLICYHGAVISQGVDHVESFYQLDELRQQVAKTLAEHPDDPQALARHGELLLDEGRFDDAVNALRKSFELADDPRTRELLVDAMLESLRLDFAAHRGLAPEIERLAQQPGQQASLLRLMALGLQKAGQLVPAFDAYSKMADLSAEPSAPERVDSGLSVRRDRWVQARLASLYISATSYAAAKPEEKRHIDTVLDRTLRECIDAKNPHRLRNFVLYFGYHPAADEARELLAAKAIESKEWLQAEHWLRQLERSSDAGRVRAAAVRLARLLAEAGRPADAAVYYRQLSGPWADEICLDGKTGREIADALPRAAEIARYGSTDDLWPTGKVDVVKDKENVAVMQGRSTPLEMRGNPGPFYDRSTVEADPNMPQQILVGRDGLGREQWRLSIKDRNDPNNFGAAVNYVRANGHVVLASLGYQVVAVDTLGTPTTPARVLWREDLNEPISGLPRQIGLNFRPAPMPWGGGHRMQAFDVNGRPMGNTSPLTSDVVCFQRLRNLMAVDPLTGETLWTRQDVPSGSELFGDDEFLFVVSPVPGNSAEATVYRLLDGEEVGHRAVPLADQRVLTRGRLVLTWELAGGGEGTLRLFDAWKQADLWKKKFNARSRFSTVGDEAVAVVEPDGHLSVLSLPDGQATIDAEIDKEPALQDVYLLRSAEVDVVITNRATNHRPNMNVAAIPGQAGTVLVNGTAYGFNRQTGQRLYHQTLSHKGLILNQPVDLPVLVFAATVQRPARNPQGARGELACLDKRTGRFVFQQEMEQQMALVDTVADPEKHEVLVRTPVQSYRLKFTGEPEAAPPPNEKKTSAATGAGRAAARLFGRLLEGIGKGGDP
ncbi:MAG: hypothetical protein B7Z73_01940 [Planctomycetia bacterium 21-64-5]|nr:MAG: hypothetical protein B7Z73_01940 [Planctomycetia bacterium 21-64-5]